MSEGSDPSGQQNNADQGDERYLTYDEYLQKYYPDADPNTPPVPAMPQLTPQLRRWRRMELPKRQAYKHHAAIEAGTFPIYGLHPNRARTANLPIFGPLTQDQTFPDISDFGPDVSQVFDDTQRFRDYLNQHGYTIVSNITRGDPTRVFDNQVWRVRNNQTQEMCACKVISVQFFYYREPVPRATSRVLEKMQGETLILQKIDHPNIIRVLDVIRIRDRLTDFEQIFLATIMEMMEGSIDSKWKDYRVPVLKYSYPKALMADMLVQLIRAVDYLHNQMNLVYTHQAIRPANILYRHMTEPAHRLLFKLADFEECRTFDRTKPEPFDVVENHQGVRVYFTNFSAPEFINATTYENLRLMPNDIYSVALSACSLIAGVDPSNRQDYGRNYISELQQGNIALNPEAPFLNHMHEVLRLMSTTDPGQRIEASDLVQNQSYKYLNSAFP